MKKILLSLILIVAIAPSLNASAQTDGEQAGGFQPQRVVADEAETPGESSVSDLAPLIPAPQPAGDLSALGSGLPISSFDIIWNIGVFLLVLALLYLVLKALGRVSRFKGGSKGGSGFAIKAIQPLDNKKYLAAVELEGRTIVVGVSADRITPVAQWLNDDEGGLDLGSAGLPGQDHDLGLKLPDDDSPSFDLGLGDLKSQPKPVDRPKTRIGSYTFETSKDKT